MNVRMLAGLLQRSGRNLAGEALYPEDDICMSYPIQYAAAVRASGKAPLSLENFVLDDFLLCSRAFFWYNVLIL